MSKSLMKIGDVAKLVGVTVRTLHHYHQIGLLIPGYLTEGGHRLYTGKDIQTLYQIVALKNFGFTLEEIRDMLGTANSDPSLLIKLQLEKATEVLSIQIALCRSLREVQQSLANRQSPSVQDMAEIIMMMQMNTKQYLSEEQIAQLRLNYNSFSKEKASQLEENWMTFIEELSTCKAEGIAFSAPQAQKLADNWRAFLQSTTGGDSELIQAVHHFHADNGHEHMRYGLSRELFEYLQQLLRATDSDNEP
jgi:MerR family transcriptional regulator, thiopeptide resistance regulator